MDVPAFPNGLFLEFFQAFSELHHVHQLFQAQDADEVLPMFPSNLFEMMWEGFETLKELYDESNDLTMDDLLAIYYPRPVQQLPQQPVWHNLIQNAWSFWYLTGETPHSFENLVQEVTEAVRYTRKQTENLNFGRIRHLSVHDQVLMTLLWLRQYPTLSSLTNFFHVNVQYAHTTIHHVLLALHQQLFRREVRWHLPAEWNLLTNSFEEFPSVVALLDCTPVRINRPTGRLQRLYYRRDRSCHFINWLVVVDTHGYFTYGQAGYMGHLSDNTCLVYSNMPQVPRGTHIMADLGFAATQSIMTPLRRVQRIPQHIRGQVNRNFSQVRVYVEHRIRELKIYRVVGGQYRGRRRMVPIIANVVMALCNRRRTRIARMRRNAHN